tara:strand:- start:191 stop:1186 length:996 start_codon:yes stop_codon:yes gene_type:complete
MSDKNETTLNSAYSLQECINFAKNLTSLPRNKLHPEDLAAVAIELAKQHDSIEVEVIEDVKKEGLNLVYAVGKGSVHKPNMILLGYHPNKNSKESISLVGKGVCFDSGGMQTKPSDGGGQEEMNGDMGGASTVLAIIKYAAEQKADVNLNCVIPCVENMTGSNAYTATDVIQSFDNGPFIHVKHTDAEGRLILADALRYTAKHHLPSKIIEFSTLTGATYNLTYHVRTVVASNENDLDKIIKIGESIGDRLQKIEIDPEHYESIDSEVADIENQPKESGKMGIQTSYSFLESSLNMGRDKNVPFIHFDISAEADKPQGAGIAAVARYLVGD